MSKLMISEAKPELLCVGVRDIYSEVTDYCDKEIDRFTHKVNKGVWKNRARRRRETQRNNRVKR